MNCQIWIVLFTMYESLRVYFLWIFKNIFPNMFILIKSLLLFQLLFMMFNKNQKKYACIYTYI